MENQFTSFRVRPADVKLFSKISKSLNGKPSVVISSCNNAFKTCLEEESNKWSDFFYIEDCEDFTMNVCVYSKNSVAPESLIGEARLSYKNIASCANNKEKKLSLSKDRKKVGEIFLQFDLRDGNEKEEESNHSLLDKGKDILTKGKEIVEGFIHNLTEAKEETKPEQKEQKTEQKPEQKSLLEKGKDMISNVVNIITHPSLDASKEADSKETVPEDDNTGDELKGDNALEIRGFAMPIHRGEEKSTDNSENNEKEVEKPKSRPTTARREFNSSRSGRRNTQETRAEPIKKDDKIQKEVPESKKIENKDFKETKESKDVKKPEAVKEFKEVKNFKDSKDSKNTKDSKDVKELKDVQEPRDVSKSMPIKEQKEFKGQKEMKEDKTAKPVVDLKENKESELPKQTPEPKKFEKPAEIKEEFNTRRSFKRDFASPRALKKDNKTESNIFKNNIKDKSETQKPTDFEKKDLEKKPEATVTTKSLNDLLPFSQAELSSSKTPKKVKNFLNKSTEQKTTVPDFAEKETKKIALDESPEKPRQSKPSPYKNFDSAKLPSPRVSSARPSSSKLMTPKSQGQKFFTDKSKEVPEKETGLQTKTQSQSQAQSQPKESLSQSKATPSKSTPSKSTPKKEIHAHFDNISDQKISLHKLHESKPVDKTSSEVKPTEQRKSTSRSVDKKTFEDKTFNEKKTASRSVDKKPVEEKPLSSQSKTNTKMTESKTVEDAPKTSEVQTTPQKLQKKRPFTAVEPRRKSQVEKSSLNEKSVDRKRPADKKENQLDFSDKKQNVQKDFVDKAEEKTSFDLLDKDVMDKGDSNNKSRKSLSDKKDFTSKTHGDRFSLSKETERPSFMRTTVSSSKKRDSMNAL